MFKTITFIILISFTKLSKISDLIYKIQSEYCELKKSSLISDFKKNYDKQEHYIIDLYNVKNPFIDFQPFNFNLYVYNLNIENEEKNITDILEVITILDYLENLRNLDVDLNQLGIQNYLGCEILVKNSNSIISAKKIDKIYVKVQKLNNYFPFSKEFDEKFYLADVFLKNYLKLKKNNFFIYDFPDITFDLGTYYNSKNESDEIVFNIFYFFDQFIENKKLEKKNMLNFENNLKKLEDRQKFIYYYPKLIELCVFDEEKDDCKINNYIENQEKWTLGLLYLKIMDFDFFYEMNETLKCAHNFVDGLCIKNLQSGLFENCENEILRTKIEKSLDALFGIVEIDFNKLEKYLGLLI